MTTHEVTLLPGDWIGPETAVAVQEIIEAAGVSIAWHEHTLPVDGTLPADVVADAKRTGVVLKNRTASRRKQGQLPSTVELRKQLGLTRAIRPVRPLPGYGSRFPDLDIFVVREITEDIYAGFEHEVTDGVYEAVKVTTRSACEHIARWAFEVAVRHERKKVTIVHKSNIMKQSDGMFLSTARAVAAEYEGRVACDDVIVDALTMKLVRWPMQFDVVLTGNLFGDIVGDLCSGLAGGITAATTCSYGDGVALFENPHGRAEDLVGTGRANPIPTLRAALYMLRHLGEHEARERIRSALHGAIAGGLRPVERGGTDGIVEIRDAIIKGL